MTEHKYRVGFLFSGSGFGARGFEQAEYTHREHVARFENAGGVDFDAVACQDFEYLTAGHATVADLATMQPADLRAAWGERAPDCVFSSPPCKAFSQLLSKEKAATREYQEMAQLFVRGLFLAVETWPDAPPSLLIFENVPAIQTRGAALLEQARQYLRARGYKTDERVFDCGEVGGLAQRRRRFTFVARLKARIPAEVNTPPLQRLKACGEVLWPLPLPNDPAAGPMHRIPEVSLLTWLRLAFIPAGGDWRDLTPSAAAYAHGRLRSPVQPGQTRREHYPRYDVRRGDQPAHTVAGSGTNGGFGVADPRVGGLPLAAEAHHHCLRVTPQTGAVQTITASPSPTSGAGAVSDPRLGRLDVREHRRGDFGMVGGDQPAASVRGQSEVQEATSAIADPRVAQLPLGYEPIRGSSGVGEDGDSSPTVRGRADVRTGPAAVADPRLAEIPLCCGREGTHTNLLHVVDGDGAARTVTGAVRPAAGAPSIADPRFGQLPLPDAPGRHWNKYHVTGADEPALTVTGADGRVGSGAPCVSDPRLPVDGQRFNHSLRVTDEHRPTGTVADPWLGALDPGAPNWNHGALGVQRQADPAHTVTTGASPSTGAKAIADDRLARLHLGRVADTADGFAGRPGHFGVDDGAAPTLTVTGGMAVSESNTPAAIADPRLAPRWREDRPGLMGVTSGDAPAATVSGKAGVTQGNMPAAVSDLRAVERLPLNCRARSGAYGVMGLDETADAVTGSACHDNGRVALAAASPPPPLPPGYRFLSVEAALDMLARGEKIKKGTVPIIASPHDGYWHRPLTDYELAILQSAPTHVNGKPLELHGTSRAVVREHIGNAVPEKSAKAWAREFLSALLRAELGVFELSATPVWVEPDGEREEREAVT